MEESVSTARRMQLLSSVPSFGLLPVQVLTRLANVLEEESMPPDTVIVREGTFATRLYIVADGEAEVSVNGPSGRIPIARLREGELFGEIALLTATSERIASVTSVSRVTLLGLSYDEVRAVIADHPELNDAFHQAAGEVLIAKFLKQATPFARIDADSLRWLSSRLEPRSCEVGELIVKQGHRGDQCFLIRTGQVEIIKNDTGNFERRVGVLGRGGIFGEGALLTDSSRNASVRAVEKSELLALRRDDLLHVMDHEQRVGQQLVELLKLRDRPRQAEGIIVHHHINPDAETITTLEDPTRPGIYHRLSALGWFVWQRLEGRHNIRELTLEYLSTHESVESHDIATIVAGLVENGFAFTKPLNKDVEEKVNRSRFSRLIGSAWNAVFGRGRRD